MEDGDRESDEYGADAGGQCGVEDGSGYRVEVGTVYRKSLGGPLLLVQQITRKLCPTS